FPLASQALTFKCGLVQVAIELRDLVRSAASPRGPQIVLRGDQTLARTRQVGADLLGAEAEQQLATLHGLAFGSGELLYKGREFRAHRVGCDGLDLAVAGDRGSQVFAPRANDGHARHRLAAAQLHERRNQQEGRKQTDPDSPSENPVHSCPWRPGCLAGRPSVSRLSSACPASPWGGSKSFHSSREPERLPILVAPQATL